MSSHSAALLLAFVERGRWGNDELVEMITRCRTATFGAKLRDRPWAAVSLPGSAVVRLGPDVVLGVPRGALDDDAIRKIAMRCPDMWLDGRWYPADAQGYHLLQATTITATKPGGIGDDVAAMLDVPADESRFVRDADTDRLRFVRLMWRTARD